MEFLCSFRKHNFACKPVASHADVLGASSHVELRDEPKQRQRGRLANQRYAVSLRNGRLFSLFKHEVNRARMKQDNCPHYRGVLYYIGTNCMTFSIFGTNSFVVM